MVHALEKWKQNEEEICFKEKWKQTDCKRVVIGIIEFVDERKHIV